jgi:hypothetical protein
MRRFFVIVLVTLFFGLPTLGHGEEKTGILVDAKCGANLAKEASKAESHPVSCALENEESGYGIIADGKFLRFDDYGNRQARLLLKATQKGANLKVRVGGHFEGDLIKVSEMETVE